ncbi:hypothetical protein OK074_4907 [Actinobacteria bacterium OK074]|nr:hypothetical protein OK074_4907 [Actinobacteria bacterium OK074]
MPNPSLLPGAPAPPAAARLRNADAFLATRGLTRAGLDELMRAKTGDARHLLLTSSPVHGIANATSDIDFIRVEDHAVQGARMATQLFEQDQHLEAVSYGAAEVDDALADLAKAAALDPADVVLAHQGWDKGHELRRKYLERLINGLSLDGSSPYLEHLPQLARVWKWSALHTAVRHVFHLRLAEAAGESRGSAGYALGALLHLADAALSHAGDVYSNRKWFLLRWQRFLAAGTADGTALAPFADRLTDLDLRVRQALRGESGAPLAPAFAAALAELFEIAGEGHEPALLLDVAEDTRPLAFLPGASMLVGATALFADAVPAVGRLAVTPGAELPADPAGLLSASRAGVLRLLPA